MENTYTIGLDFGTLSGRALLVRVSDGAEIGYETFTYPHAVLDRALPSGRPLGDHYALQDPDDYLEVVYKTIPALLHRFSVRPEEVVGIGVDFTSCTVLPVKADGTPLCKLQAFSDEPHAWVKLWKHHAAQYCADRINALAKERNESWLARYGGKISSEFLYPKLLQIALEAPGVLDSADLFIEAGDWLVWQLTGTAEPVRSACMAGYKALWSAKEGFPSKAFLDGLAPDFGGTAERLLRGKVLPVASSAGTLSEQMAKATGLHPGTAVATAVIDAHAAYPAAGYAEEGALFMIMGTSTCHISVSNTYKEAPGICGIVKDGVLPGYYGYEAGQACVGDHFKWLSENCIPADFAKEAAEKGISALALLSEKAEKQAPGECGLLALDWWNGSRTPLVDGTLTGLLLGMTLTTRPEDIYRALLEATAYGTRAIVENYNRNGIPIQTLLATGGMAESSFVLQIYADVTGLPIYTAASANGPALGAAIFGALAAGKTTGGYAAPAEAIAAMGKLSPAPTLPREEAHKVYNRLYAAYDRLTNYFGRGENPVMKELQAIRKNAGVNDYAISENKQ